MTLHHCSRVAEALNFSLAKPVAAKCKASMTTLSVEGPGIAGAVGMTYRTSLGVIFKFAHQTSEAWEFLCNEVGVYNKLKKNRVLLVPTYYGLFKTAINIAIALSDEGDSLRGFSDLTQEVW